MKQNEEKKIWNSSIMWMPPSQIGVEETRRRYGRKLEQFHLAIDAVQHGNKVGVGESYGNQVILILTSCK